METIGKRLHRLRDQKEMSQDEVATRIGIDRTSYH
jgi:transcriptional regulator with XRE-family HTH domain